MDSDLALYIKSGKLVSEWTAVWGDGIHLEIIGYLGIEQPPIKYVTSVRGVVFRNNEVLIVRGPNGYHVIPGGRREKGEKLEETLCREILEESGWTIGELSLLGFMHFHHLSPKPANYDYSYPDFLWLLYIAEAGKHIPRARIQGEWELGVDFYPIDDARLLPLENGQLELLQAAVENREKRKVQNQE